MANVTLGGTPVETIGNLPAVGSKAPSFKLTGTDLADKSNSDFDDSRLVLNIFPSVDTGTCAQSIRTFNEKASQLENTKVLCISKDLPFAMARFCGAEGIGWSYSRSNANGNWCSRIYWNIDLVSGYLICDSVCVAISTLLGHRIFRT